MWPDMNRTKLKKVSDRNLPLRMVLIPELEKGTELFTVTQLHLFSLSWSRSSSHYEPIGAH